MRVVVRVRARWRKLSRSYDSCSSYGPIKAGTEKLLRTVERALLVGGVGMAGYWLAVFVSASAFQSAHEREFSKALEDKLSTTLKNSAERIALAKPHSLAEGSVIGQLAIPRVSLSVMVVEGAGDRDLKLGAGHIQGT